MLTRLFLLAIMVSHSVVAAQPDTATESDYYKLVTYTIPEGINLEAGAIEPLPDGTLAVSTRAGDIYRIHDAWNDDASKAKFTLFASGLQEVLGLAWKDGWLYATQRCEVTRLRDTDNDGVADEVETFSDAWGVSGNYHEYAYSSPFDSNGNMWVTLCLTGSFTSEAKYRGWCLRIDRDGNAFPECSGIRSPGGMQFNSTGDLFYTDNQGPWNGTCSLKWLRPGSFQGHPIGNRWYKDADAQSVIGPAPAEPKSGSRIMTEADRIPEYEPPAILFPYKKMGHSSSAISLDVSKGKFGPFADQLFVGEYTLSSMSRCFLEKVKGHYQGACFPFREGFSTGVISMQMTGDGSMFVGGASRSWAARGTKPFAVERLVWTGKTPFEIHEMRAKHDGFELTFTQPVDATTATNPASWTLGTYTYIYQSSYGSPEVDHTTPKITKINITADGMSARLFIDGLQRGHVHELHAAGLRSANGNPLLHDAAYYTLNNIPDNHDSK